jgi:hypothetical protein
MFNVVTIPDNVILPVDLGHHQKCVFGNFDLRLVAADFFRRNVGVDSRRSLVAEAENMVVKVDSRNQREFRRKSCDAKGALKVIHSDKLWPFSQTLY